MLWRLHSPLEFAVSLTFRLTVAARWKNQYMLSPLNVIAHISVLSNLIFSFIFRANFGQTKSHREKIAQNCGKPV